MKFKKKHNPSNYNNLESNESQNEQDLWFKEIADDPSDFKPASEDIVTALKEEAKKCIDSEIANYNIKNTKGNSDYRWMKTATQKGTVSDKIAASTVLIQNSPVTNLELLRNLVSMVKVGKKKECIVVIDTLTELFLTSLLKPNVKLKSFHQRPLMLLTQISSGNARTRQKYLVHWYFEDQLKEIYSNFIVALNTAAHDTLDVNKEKAIGAMYKLLAANPEQEKNLLIYIVNKLGDPSQKVASKAIYCLNQLLFKHSNMQSIVLNEIEKLQFRSNVGQKAQYYGICFLSQFYLNHESSHIARRLIEVYFSFFKACIKQGEVDSRMMSALLMGVNRAYPYAKLELQKFDEHIDTMYRVVHMANFNIGLHALMLLYQVSDYGSNTNNRFYSALYKKLNDPKLVTITHQAMFLNLLYKSLMKDTETTRIKAFIKRLLQVALFMQPPFACGVLYLISQVMVNKPNLYAINLEESDMVPLVKFEDNEEEKYVDIIDTDAVIKVEDEANDDENQLKPNISNDDTNDEEKPDIESVEVNTKEGSSWYHCTTIKQEKKNPIAYDPFNRNPLFAGADYTAYIELLNLKEHYHPTVSLYADKLLQGQPINYSGDPLKDFSLIRFLDRFVFKNPKKSNTNDGSHPTFGKRKRYTPSGLRSLALGSQKYLQQNEMNIPVDELFLYKYMQERVSDKKADGEDADLESVASEEFEEMLDKMSSFKDIDDDLDYMNEVENNLNAKSNKNNRDTNDIDSNESDIEDMNDDDEDVDSANESDSDGMEPTEEDKEFLQDMDEDNMSDVVFTSDDDGDETVVNNKNKKKNKGDINSIFASAEEFASLLEDEGNNSKVSGSSHVLSNKDNAATKQIAWEEKRNWWLQGYNKAIGKKGPKLESSERKYKKRPIKNKYNKNKKRRTS